MRLPFVTVVLPVLNEEKTLPRALGSIASQDYPRESMEVLVVDGGSEDRSKEVIADFAASLPVRLIDNTARREAEWGKALALTQARGDLFQCMDADMWCTAPDMLRALATPLARDGGLAGTVAPYAYIRHTSVWNRLLSCDALQRDPLLQALTPGLEQFRVEQGPEYDVCEFHDAAMPPFGGTTMFRREELRLDRWGGVFRDVDHAAYLVKSGRTRFALLDEPRWGHEHCHGLHELVRKRVRNLRGLDASFLAQGHRDFIWWDVSRPSERLRMVRWIIGSNLIAPRLLEGIADAVRLRRWEPLLRPVIALVITDALILDMLTSSDGRKFIGAALVGKAGDTPI